MKELQGAEARPGQVVSQTPDGNSHTVRWVEWGAPDSTEVLICAHGLSRNGRDFDFLAQALMDRYRVICPDYPGRGSSDWLSDAHHYHNLQYLRDTMALIASLGNVQIDWVGTSMGGIIGMGLGSLAQSPVRRLVINDIGAFIPREPLSGIGKYLSMHPRFATLDEVKRYFQSVYEGFGPLEDHHYDHFVRYGVWMDPDGSDYVLAVDPAMIDQFVSIPPEDVSLWDVWDKIRIPTLIVRGEQSEIFPSSVLDEMIGRHPEAHAVVIPGCGHAPSLMMDDQIQFIREWLEERTGA